MLILAGALLVVIAAAALSIDMGYMWAYKRHEQTAADAAAVAAASAGHLGNCISCAGKGSSALNGFTDGQNNVTVTVNNPPTSGTFAAKAGYVEAIVQSTVPTFFMRAIGLNTVTLTSRAVSSFGNTAGPSFNNGDCIYALNPTASSALSYDGVSAWWAPACDVLVRSSSSSAVEFDDVTLTWDAIGIVGNYDVSPLLLGLLNLIHPKPVTGIAPFTDPLAYLAAPTVPSTCDHTNFATSLLNPIAFLSPGTYCGGITANGIGVINLSPGVYIIRGGGINITGVAVMLGTSGVTFYITGDSTHPYKGVNMNLGVNASILRAPTCGTYSGILFFQDRTISAATAAANPNSFLGAAVNIYEGTLYFPTTAVSYSGAAATNPLNVVAPILPGLLSGVAAKYTIIIADKIHFTGVAITEIGADYSGLCNGSPVKKVTVVE